MKKHYALFCFCFAMLQFNFLSAQIVITEIMYNNAGADDLEFIELYNNSNETVALQGYTFSSGVNYTFPDISLQANEYLVVCSDSVLIDAVFGITAYQWTSGALNNSGELIELSDANDNIIDAVDFDDSAPWSNFADGNGPSLVLCDANADNNAPANWQAASTDSGIIYSNVPLVANPGVGASCNQIPLLSLEEFELTINEDVGTIAMNVEIENPSSNPTEVMIEVHPISVAALGTDFNLSISSLTFPSNSTDVQSFDIIIEDDTELEMTEQITLVLRNPTNNAILLTDSLNIFIGDNDTPLTQQMILTGVWDAQLPASAGSKGFEIYVREDIADLSLYGIGVANNGGGTDGLEWNFPSGSAMAGEFLYIAEDSTEFHDYFGFAPTYDGGIAAINGDDAVELYENSQVIDVFGEIDGSNASDWNYQDGWAYRRLGTGPDGSTFILDNWIISGTDALDGATTNIEAPTPFPIRTYSVPMNTVAQDDHADGTLNTPITIDVLSNDFLPTSLSTITIIFSSNTNGSISVNEDYTLTYLPPTDFCGIDTFDYEVCDDNSCDEATVTIDIPCPPSYPAYSIGIVTTNDPTGVPDSIDVSCQLEGRVYGVNIKNDGGLSFVIIDAAGDGIVCFSDDQNFGYTVNEGDEVTVQGVIDQYNGLTELILDNVETTTLDIEAVTPTIVTELNESTESQLVRIENLIMIDPSEWDSDNGSSGFNVRFEHGSDTITVRIDNDVDMYNMPPPGDPSTWAYDITGLGGQFDFSSPYDEGYQLLPRYEADINGYSVSTHEIAFDFSVNVFPNPTAKHLFIQTEKQLDKVTISNISGQIIQQIARPNQQHQIDVSNFEKGIYTIIMEKDGVQVSTPILVQ